MVARGREARGCSRSARVGGLGQRAPVELDALAELVTVEGEGRAVRAPRRRAGQDQRVAFEAASSGYLRRVADAVEPVPEDFFADGREDAVAGQPGVGSVVLD